MPKQLRSEKYAASLEADVDSALSALEGQSGFLCLLDTLDPVIYLLFCFMSNHWVVGRTPDRRCNQLWTTHRYECSHQSICFVKRTTENDAVKLELDVDQVTEELIGSCDAARKAVDIACEPLKSTKKAKKA